jgi:hypothetical protein
MNGKSVTLVFDLLVVIVILAINVSAKGQAEATDINRARARQLWEEALQAKGGRDRLHAVQNFLISGEIQVEAVKGSHTTEVQWLHVLPGKAWLHEYTPEFVVSLDATVINIERDLCMKILSPARGDVPSLSLCLPTAYAERLIQNPTIYLIETKWIRPVPIRTYEGRRGLKRVDVVETAVGNLRVDFYLDRKTRLPVKLVTDEYGAIYKETQAKGLTVYFDNYVTIDGIQMPTKVVREPRHVPLNEFSVPSLVLSHEPRFPEKVRRDTELLKYKFNVEYENTIFDGPASRKVKATDWKPRNRID